jgi:hypothetical protein
MHQPSMYLILRYMLPAELPISSGNCRRVSSTQPGMRKHPGCRATGWSGSDGDPSAFRITANFGEGQMAGTSGVNSYFGPYTAAP